MRNFMLCSMVLALPGCAAPPPATSTSKVAVADQSAVARCAYLDTVFGSSGWYGAFAEQGMTNARASALQQAEKAGATHIVWLPAPQTHGSSQLAGKVYRCP